MKYVQENHSIVRVQNTSNFLPTYRSKSLKTFYLYINQINRLEISMVSYLRLYRNHWVFSQYKCVGFHLKERKKNRCFLTTLSDKTRLGVENSPDCSHDHRQRHLFLAHHLLV